MRRTSNSVYLQDVVLENNIILNSIDFHTFISRQASFIIQYMLLLLLLWLLLLLLFYAASQLDAVEDEPGAVHRLEKPEPVSLQVLQQAGTALPAAPSQLPIMPPLLLLMLGEGGDNRTSREGGGG